MDRFTFSRGETTDCSGHPTCDSVYSMFNLLRDSGSYIQWAAWDSLGLGGDFYKTFPELSGSYLILDIIRTLRHEVWCEISDSLTKKAQYDQSIFFVFERYHITDKEIRDTTLRICIVNEKGADGRWIQTSITYFNLCM